MATLKDLLVSGPSRFIGDVYANKVQLTSLSAPTSAGSTTYGVGTSGQYLRTNGISLYWSNLDTSGTWSGTATTSSYPLGFASRSTNATWGNQTGSTVTCWNDSSGGSVDWRTNNPSSGKLSLKVDGRFYGNEGANPAMLMSDPNGTGYWGMGNPDGANNVWIRTTSSGIIPFQSGSQGSGHNGLGTSTWYFSTSYIDTMYGGKLTSGTTLYINSAASTSMIFQKGDSEIGRWNSSGNLMVGVASDQDSNMSYKLYVSGTSYFSDNITSNKSIYFGNNSSSGKPILAYSSSYPNYGIWYFDESTDVMTFSASGNANSKDDADFAINHLGAGTLSNRNKRIPHTNNTSGTVGSATQPVYVNAGAITAITGAIANDTTGNAATATKATQLATGRTLKVALNSVNASTAFNGTANVHDIGVSGILGTANGGTNSAATPTAYALMRGANDGKSIISATNILSDSTNIYPTTTETGGIGTSTKWWGDIYSKTYNNSIRMYSVLAWSKTGPYDAGWKRVCALQGFNGYGVGRVYINGSWSSEESTLAAFEISFSHTNYAHIKQTLGARKTTPDQVRLVYSGTGGKWYFDIHIPARTASSATGTRYVTFIGRLTVSEKDETTNLLTEEPTTTTVTREIIVTNDQPTITVDLASTTAGAFTGANMTTGITGTLPVAQGGTGNTSYTANTLIYAESATKLSSRSNLIVDGYTLKSSYTTGGADIGFRAIGKNYTMSFIIGSGDTNRGIYDSGINSWWFYHNGTNTIINNDTQVSTRLGVNGRNTSYTFYTNGTSYFNGNVTHNGIDYFANGTTYYINNSGTANLNALTVNNTTASTSTSTGAIIIKGGAGIAGVATASEFNATRPMVLSAGKIYSNISGSNVLLPAKTTKIFSDGIAIANPELTAANDVGWIRVTGTAESNTVLEIATGDDGGTGEKIEARQYNASNAIAQYFTILDIDGRTKARDIFPQINNTYTLGNSDNKWKELYVMSFAPDYSYPSTTKSVGGGWTDLFGGNQTGLETGTYIIQLKVGSAYYSGVCSWINTNGATGISALYTEIPLHGVQASLSTQYYLRTALDANGLYLQISSSNSTAANVTVEIKMKKIM